MEILTEPLSQVELFADLDAEQLDWLAEAGTPLQLADGQLLFQDGEPARFYVLLEGELQVSKTVGDGQRVLDRHPAEPGGGDRFLGEVPLLSGTDWVGTATALRPCRLVVYDRAAFFAMLARCPQICRVLLPVLAGRIRADAEQSQQSLMLSGLGTLAAGLAHELNNPIAAAVRGSSRLRQLLADLEACATSWGELSTPQERELVTAMLGRLLGEPNCSRGALALAETTDLLDDWLAGHAFDEPGSTAGVLAECGFEVELLTELAAQVRPEVLTTAVAALAVRVEAAAVLDDVAQAAGRVEDLVLSTKEYANLDRAPEREVQLSAGLDATLTLLGAQLSGITVHRSYAELPPVPVFAGELNQVWTNLLQNAIDALQGQGELTICTWREGDYAVVEIRDSGPGIDAELLPCIFQPFLSTKDCAPARGLGLHLSRETVIRRHAGTIDVSSVPGDTRFTVRLPLRR